MWRGALIAVALWGGLPSTAAADEPQITTTSQFIEQCDVATPSIQCGTTFQIYDMLSGGTPSCYSDGIPSNPNLDPKLDEITNRYMRGVVRALAKWLKTHPHSEDLGESAHAAALAVYPCKAH
jgi:hypothetical protein